MIAFINICRKKIAKPNIRVLVSEIKGPPHARCGIMGVSTYSYIHWHSKLIVTFASISKIRVAFITIGAIAGVPLVIGGIHTLAVGAEACVSTSCILFCSIT